MLAGKTVIDCTNAADFGTGRLLLETGSAAEVVVGLAAGAHVVKALNLFAGPSWPFTGAAEASPVVAMCGDDLGALGRATSLIADLGARTAVLGGLAGARQAEEAAGFVIHGRWPVGAFDERNTAFAGIALCPQSTFSLTSHRR